MEKRKVIGWGTGGPLYEDEIKARGRESTIRLALREIADAQGDVDAFIDQYDENTRKVPRIAAEIACRLLEASRTEEALQTIEAAEHRRSGWPDFDWEEARIAVLDALGRGDEAQTARWSCFERALSAEHLRAYLKRLPDFDESRPKSGRSIMRSATTVCFRGWRSCCPGPPWIEPHAL